MFVIATSATASGQDACTEAVSIPAEGGTFVGQTTGTGGYSACAFDDGAPERIFKWTPAQSGYAVISTCGPATTFDTVLYLDFRRCRFFGTERCDDDGCAPGSIITPEVVAGEDYYIIVDGYGHASGTFELQVTPPGRGDCADPSTFPGGWIMGTTAGASSAQAGSCGGGGAPERVFEWIPDVSGTATLSTCSMFGNFSTDYDTLIYVREGTCEGGSELACDDDACPTRAGSSRVVMNVRAGTPYYVFVDGFGSARGAFTLEVEVDQSLLCGNGVLDPFEECDDGNEAYGDGCDPYDCRVAYCYRCVGEPSICTFDVNAPCDDGDPCTTDERCMDGACGGGVPIVCAPSDQCHATGECDPYNGCPNTPLPGMCDDDVSCTLDSCHALDGCLHTPLDALCDDGDPCTVDHCDPATGCHNERVAQCTAKCATALDCDDGQFCNGVERCNLALGCQAGTFRIVDDGVACTVDACDEVADAVVHDPDDGRCDDANPCTDDRCDPTVGCRHAPRTGGCDDGIACTIGDTCIESRCTGTPDDGLCDGTVACDRSSRCDAATGCVPSVSTPCEDGDACTHDACGANGACEHSAVPDQDPAGLSCELVNIRAVVAAQGEPVCRETCLREVARAIARVGALVSQDPPAGRRACRLRFSRLVSAASSLQRLIARLTARGTIGPSGRGEALAALTHRLRDRAIGVARSGPCGPARASGR